MVTRDVRGSIERKKAGRPLGRDEIVDLVQGYLAGEVGEEQMAALLMAGVLRGFDRDEAVALTEALVSTGRTIDLRDLPGPTIDKHSTGGVGDTATLVVAPVLAACGLQVAKLSGRALGHTGGTLDKLEAVPGLRVELSTEEFHAQVARIGIAIAAATADLVPGDKRLYALRDVTATIDAPALIAASVMSKKIAGGAAHVVLDVKTGNGAFMQQLREAAELARLCVEIGESHGRATAAVVTDMDQPLGRAVGNALEVRAAIDVLGGRGELHPRLTRLSVELAEIALAVCGRGDGRAEVERALGSGAALERFRDMVAAQGGDPRVVDDPVGVLPRAPVVEEWAPGAGTVQRLACRGLGELAHRLGAGRAALGVEVDDAVGLELLGEVGDELESGQPLVRIHAPTREAAAVAADALAELVVVGDHAPPAVPLVHERLGRATSA